MRQVPSHLINELESALGYEFVDSSFLQVALTTPSYKSDRPRERNLQDNQRLEFLGDAVFGLLATEQLFDNHRKDDEGSLTARRTHLVSGVALARLAHKIRLGDYLILGNGEEKAGGRTRDKILADAMEAVFGAAWCDGGLAAVRRIYRHLRVGEESTSMNEVLLENPKGELQKFCQRRHWANPVYEILDASGPPHAPTFTVRVQIQSGKFAEGTGGSKHLAESFAAQNLVRELISDGVLSLGGERRG